MSYCTNRARVRRSTITSKTTNKSPELATPVTPPYDRQMTSRVVLELVLANSYCTARKMSVTSSWKSPPQNFLLQLKRVPFAIVLQQLDQGALLRTRSLPRPNLAHSVGEQN